MLTVPVLLKLPLPELIRPSDCVPAADLLKVPALVNAGVMQQSMATGTACVLERLNTPPGWFTKAGVAPLPVDAKSSRSSPPKFTVPVLIQRRVSRTMKLAPAALRFTVLVAPSGVSSVPLSRSSADVPLAVKLPVTATVPLPPSTGAVPVRVSAAKVVVSGALRFRRAPLIVRVSGSASADTRVCSVVVPPVSERVPTLSGSAVKLSVAPLLPRLPMVVAPIELATRLPPLAVRLGSVSPPFVSTKRLPPLSPSGSSASPPALDSVTLPPLTRRLPPPAGLLAGASVRVPPANSSAAPAATW